MKTTEIIAKHYEHTQLTIVDGVIFDLSNGRPLNKQMGAVANKIAAKVGFTEGAGGEVAYQFKMVGSTDQPWRAIFAALYPKAPTKFEGSTLHITCAPDQLATIFARVKETFELTNVAYRQATPEVRRLAEAQDASRLAQKQQAEQQAEQHQQKLRTPFDDLKL